MNYLIFNLNFIYLNILTIIQGRHDDDWFPPGLENGGNVNGWNGNNPNCQSVLIEDNIEMILIVVAIITVLILYKKQIKIN